MKNIKSNAELTDKFEMMFLEMPKIAELNHVAKLSKRDMWALFLSAENEEVLSMLQNLDKEDISENSSSIKKSRQNDYKRFIEKTSCTKDGEIASKGSYDIKEDLIKEEAKYDGYYSVCTNLED